MNNMNLVDFLKLLKLLIFVVIRIESTKIIINLINTWNIKLLT